MKAIDKAVAEMRRADRIVIASLLKTWKSGLSFIGLLLVAWTLRNDPSLVVSYGKFAIAFIGLLNWVTNAYFVRKYWGLKNNV